MTPYQDLAAPCSTASPRAYETPGNDSVTSGEKAGGLDAVTSNVLVVVVEVKAAVRK